jgi:hypothetical protein
VCHHPKYAAPAVLTAYVISPGCAEVQGNTTILISTGLQTGVSLSKIHRASHFNGLPHFAGMRRGAKGSRWKRLARGVFHPLTGLKPGVNGMIARLVQSSLKADAMT